MHKLIAVEEATALMEQGKEWSVWRWLLNKSRVRAAADRAVDALLEAEKQVLASWGADLKLAYRELEAQQALEGNPRLKQRYEKAKEEAKHVSPELKQEVRKAKQAIDEAEKARLEAEDQFAVAEGQLSASGARLGAEKAIRSWEMRMKAIRKAEAVGKKVAA